MCADSRIRRSHFMSAALRHLRDAEHLAGNHENRSLDQAWHLAGFGPECARKACFSERWADTAIGHDFGDDSESVLDMLSNLDLHAYRRIPKRWARTFPTLQKWNVSSRYWPDGRADETETLNLLEEGRRAVDAVLLVLWVDGFVSREDLE